MKILLTGATGFVGTHLSDTLISAGHEVHALVRKSSQHQILTEKGIHLVFGDLATEIPPLPAFDAVIHLAGLIKAKQATDFYRVNEQGTARLAQALAQNPPERFVYVSSIAARGPNVDAHSFESKGPVSDYGKSKRAGEDVLQSHLNPQSLVIVRPPIVYGPGDKETLSLFKLLKRGVFPSLGKGEMRTSFIHVKDLSIALLAAAQGRSPICQPLYPDDGASGYNVQNLMECGKSVFNRPVRKLRLPLGLLKVLCGSSELVSKVMNRAPMLSRGKFMEMREPYWFCDNTELRQCLNDLPKPIGLHEGFLNTANWYTQNGWL